MADKPKRTTKIDPPSESEETFRLEFMITPTQKAGAELGLVAINLGLEGNFLTSQTIEFRGIPAAKVEELKTYAKNKLWFLMAHPTKE